MRWAIAAVLLTVVQTIPPTPRQATNNSAKAAAHVQAKSQTNQTPSENAPSPAKADGNGESQSNSSQQHADKTEHTIGISKLPPVSVTKDWADWGVWVFSFLLVVVGFLQIWLLWGTLGAIRRQVDATNNQVDLAFGQLRAMNDQITEMSKQTDILEKSVAVAKESADVARDSVSAMKSKERARITVSLVPGESFDFKTIPPDLSELGFPKPQTSAVVAVVLKVEQVGPTPAFNVVGRAGVSMAATRDLPLPRILMPIDLGSIMKESSSPNFHPAEFVITEQQLDDIRDKKLFVHLIGNVTYTDTFGDQHVTTFRYIWNADIYWMPPDIPPEMASEIDDSRWEPIGLTQENYAT
jgi:hypothetical protein